MLVLEGDVIGCPVPYDPELPFRELARAALGQGAPLLPWQEAAAASLRQLRLLSGASASLLAVLLERTPQRLRGSHVPGLQVTLTALAEGLTLRSLTDVAAERCASCGESLLGEYEDGEDPRYCVHCGAALER